MKKTTNPNKQLRVVFSSLFLFFLVLSGSAQVTIFSEDFSSSSFTTNGWTFSPSQGNWLVGTSYTPTGGTSPNAYFNWSPSVTSYSYSLVSPIINGGPYNNITLGYDLLLNNFSTSTLEQFSVEYKTVSSGTWTMLYNQDNTGGSASFNQTAASLIGMDGQTFQIRFTAYGANSFNINGWGLDNILVQGTFSSACSGIPAPGNTIASDTLVCPITNFTVSLQNSINGSGITYQWQSSPDNITYTDIAGATASFYTGTQTTTTYYQCRVICSAGPDTATSTPIHITQNVPMNCHCIPVVSTLACVYDWISNVTTSSGITNINNTSACSATSYTDYSATQIASQTAGLPLDLSLTSAGYGMYWDIYVDYNDDGVFSASEDVLQVNTGTAFGAQTALGSFIIPIGTIPGDHRMRIRANYASYINDPCSILYEGETEDYTLTVITPVPCSGTPAPGNTTSTATSICSSTNFTLSFQNINLGSGVTYQWQSSTDNVTYTDIVGATSNFYTTSALVSTYYQCITTCSGNNGISTPLLVNITPCVNMSNGSTTTCSGSFYDSGGPGSNYQNSESYTYTIYPDAGNLSSVTFNSFTIETCCDHLTIYNGPDATYPSLGTFTTISAGTVFSSTDPTGALTFVFSSDGSVTYAGWDATIGCIPNPPCSGVPAPGNTLSTSATACVGVPFTLSLQNNVIASAQAFQWQSSPDGVTYTDIAGATLPSYTVASQTTTTYYQCLVICTTGPDTATSTPIQIIQNAAINCYCTPVVSTYACLYDWISNVTTSSGITNINNTSACSATSYTDYTATQIASQTAGLPLNLSLSSAGYGMYWNVFVDYNNDGVFSASEDVLQVNNGTAFGAQTALGSFIIPIGTTPGDHRMRIRANYLSYINDPCLILYEGETEDYTLTVLAPVPCSGPPAPGNTTSTSTLVCPTFNFTLSLQNINLGGGVTYQWQSSPDGATWTDVAGETNQSYSLTQSVNTYYQCLVVCTAGPDTTISTPILVSMNSIYNCYCNTSQALYTYDEEIFSVDVNGSVNAYNCTTVAPGPGSILNRYSNFTTLGPLTTINPGLTVPFTIQENECDGSPYYSNGCAIWIDFNQNGSYSDPGEQVYIESTTTVSPRTITGSFTVPANAVTGLTGMRVVVAEGYYGASLTPCLTYGYGETEDYIINIGAATYDMGILNDASPLPAHCYTNAETVSVTVKNFGGDTLNMSVNPLTINCAVTGANPNNTVFTPVVINTGLFLPFTTQVVTFSTNFDMSANGTYVINASTTVATDGSTNNDANTSIYVKNTAPTVTATPDQWALCQGLTTGVLATPVTSVAVDTIIWTPSAGLSAADIAYPQATPSATTTYSVTVVDALGCSATDTALVTIHQLPPVTINASSLTPCIGVDETLSGAGALIYFWDNGVTDGVPFPENAYTTTTYNVTGLDQFGCTNTASVTLTVNPLPTISTSASVNPVCANTAETLIASGSATVYIWDNGVTNGLAFGPAVTTTYHVIGTDGNGCMSPDSITVLVNQPAATNQTVTVCPGGSVTVGSNVYNVSGTYTDLAVAANTCDSVITTTLIVSAPITATQNITICSGSHLTVGTNVYSTAGTYTDVLTAFSGCDSTLTSNLTVNAPVTTSQTFVLCAGGNVMVGTNMYTSSGVYNDTLSAVNACDSVVVTNLTVNAAITTTQSIAICAGGSYTIGTSSYNTAGNYTDVLTSAAGCDSTVTTNLTVNPTITGTQTFTICASDSVVVGTSVYHTTGIFTDVLITSLGCDSTVTTNLTVTTLPVVTVTSTTICDGATATLTANGATTYTWTTGATPATSNTATATPAATTSYTVTGTVGSCTNTAISTVTVNPTPTVTLAAFPMTSICAQHAPIALPVGTPAGGTYTGAAVVGTMFTPSMSVVGVNAVTYTFTLNGCTNQAFQNITVLDCTGITESTFNNEINIYPNPTGGMFNISISNANFAELTISVVDIRGREVYKSIDKNIVAQFNKQINLEQVAKGIYYIKLSNGTDVKIQKLVIE
ncbi:MAG: GEVED domain-containing protein [Bacteroidota bacterium]